MGLIKGKITSSDTKKTNCVKGNRVHCKLSEILLQYFPFPPPELHNPCNLKTFLVLIVGIKRGKKNMLYSIEFNTDEG